MAIEEFVFEDLTPNEERTLAELRRSGKKVYAAPIEIEENAESRARQFASLGISWKQVRDYPLGTMKIKVHYVPADEATYRFLINELGDKYRTAFRKNRCLIPGKLKPLIRCPDENKCTNCPHPECRDQRQANEISYDGMIESGFETNGVDGIVYEDPAFHQIEVEDELKAVIKVIATKNPKYAKAIVMKEYHGMKVPEIAVRLKTTERNVRFYISEAQKIGKKYKEDNE